MDLILQLKLLRHIVGLFRKNKVLIVVLAVVAYYICSTE